MVQISELEEDRFAGTATIDSGNIVEIVDTACKNFGQKPFTHRVEIQTFERRGWAFLFTERPESEPLEQPIPADKLSGQLVTLEEQVDFPPKRPCTKRSWEVRLALYCNEPAVVILPKQMQTRV